MMTVSQLCLIFIFSFVLGTQSQNSSTTTPGNQNLTPGDPTVTPVPTSVELNTANPDGTPGLPDNDTVFITILSETSLVTDMTTSPNITDAPNVTDISTSAAPPGICTPPCGANANCSVVEGPPKCVCVEGYIEVGENSTCEAKTCNNSCTETTEQCSEENGYNCTCIEGYSRQGDDCIKDQLPTTEPNLTVATDTPLPTGTPLTTENNLETTEVSTEPSEATTSAKPAETTKPQKTSGFTEPTKPGGSTASPSTPDKKDVTGGHNYTGALIGLFIFLIVTCFVFVAVYVVRRRKLRNNYGRLDEDNEGDSGWSAFSKNPIYRGDRDYQLL